MKKSINAMLLILVFFVSTTAYAATPWLTDEGVKVISISYVSESFTEKWLGTDKSPIPEISQQSTLLSLNFGLTESLMLDAQIGYTQSQFDKDPAPTRGDFGGRADSAIGLTWQFNNEFIDEMLPTINLRAGIIIKGDYERSSAGNPHAPGDRANGFELSTQLGKYLFDNISLQGELGYRWRSDDVPNDLFYSLGINYSVNEMFSIAAHYLAGKSQSGIDIKGAGFTPDLFHTTREERAMAEISASLNMIQGHGLTFGIADVLDGRNTGNSEIWYLAYSYAFY